MQQSDKPGHPDTIEAAENPDVVAIPVADLISLANALWAIRKRLVRSLPVDTFSAKFDLLLSECSDILGSHGIEIMDLTGNAFSEGLAVEIVAVEGIKDESAILRISEAIRPIILLNQKLLQHGQVVLSYEEPSAFGKPKGQYEI